MQIGGITGFLSQITSPFNKNNTNKAENLLPSPEIWVNTVVEKLSIEKKSDAKEEQIKRSLTGYGKESDELIERISRSAANSYKAMLESELQNKIKELTVAQRVKALSEYSQETSFGYLPQSQIFLSLYS